MNCIRLLLSAGARLAFDRWGNSPLADAENYANRTGNSEPIRILRAVEGRTSGSMVEASPQGLNTQQLELLQKQTALTAAADGDIVTLRKLLDAGLDVDCNDYDKRTPLTVSRKANDVLISEAIAQKKMSRGDTDEQTRAHVVNVLGCGV